MPSILLALPLLALGASAQYTATYDPHNLPQTSEEGQYGTNACGTTSSQDSNCQNAYINSVNDFCLWTPPSTTSPEGDGTSKIGNVEQIVIASCLNGGYGTRTIPDGTISSAHFVKVISDKVSYVQVTGTGDLTKLLIPAGDDGGELDPHSWTGLGNPQGGLVFSNAFTGSLEQTHEWTSFMSSNDFCFRACRDGPNAAAYCQHIYDVLSCGFTIPGDHGPGFDDCLGDPTDEAPGVYGGSTFHQGDPTTPAPHPPGATSQCTPYSTIGGGTANLDAVTLPANSSATSSPASSAANSSAANSTVTRAVSSASNGTSTVVSSTSTGPARSSASVVASTASSAARSGASAASAAQSSGAAALQNGVSGGVVGLAVLAAFFA